MKFLKVFSLALLALAQAMDCVVGPETGVLNAVGFEPMGKVVLLSHSSPENLTKHWVNTHVMQPFTDCHPCHRLHHDRTFCREHEISGAAQCAWDIPPYSVFTAIAQVQEVMTQQNLADHYLVVRVVPAGCSGLGYDLNLVAETKPGDLIWEQQVSTAAGYFYDLRLNMNQQNNLFLTFFSSFAFANSGSSSLSFLINPSNE